MPAPAVTAIIAVLSSVAAILAFKEFVYDPHLAPRFELWIETQLAERRARRQARAGMVAVPVQPPPVDKDGSGSGGGLASIRKKFHWGSKPSDDQGNQEGSSAVELEGLMSKEVNVWRSEVDRSQQYPAELRHRSNASGSRSNNFNGVNAPLPFPSTDTSQITSDASIPSTPGSSAIIDYLSASTGLSMTQSSHIQPSLNRAVTEPVPSVNVIFSTSHSNSESGTVNDLGSLSMSSHSSTPNSPFSAIAGETIRSPFVTLSEMESDTDAEMFSAVSHVPTSHDDDHGDETLSEVSWTSVRGPHAP